MNFICGQGLQENEKTSEKSIAREGGEVQKQTCIKVKGTVGVSMETEREGERRILLSLLLPE